LNDDLPLYRITVELLRPKMSAYNGDRFGIRALDSGRSWPYMRLDRLTPRFSVDIATSALSLWIAHEGMNFIDGPWHERPRQAVPADIGWMEAGLSE
jgi:hypothetical protein